MSKLAEALVVLPAVVPQPALAAVRRGTYLSCVAKKTKFLRSKK
ncbi:hypothetical protein ACTSKR_03675 [Chitinibacteraceae bacterium HSL-7]